MGVVCEKSGKHNKVRKVGGMCCMYWGSGAWWEFVSAKFGNFICNVIYECALIFYGGLWFPIVIELWFL